MDNDEYDVCMHVVLCFFFYLPKRAFAKCHRKPVNVVYLIVVGRRDSSDGTRTRLSVRARRVRTPALQRPAQQRRLGALLPFHQLCDHGGHAFRSLSTVNGGFSFHAFFSTRHLGCTECKYNTRTSSTRSRSRQTSNFTRNRSRYAVFDTNIILLCFLPYLKCFKTWRWRRMPRVNGTKFRTNYSVPNETDEFFRELLRAIEGMKWGLNGFAMRHDD